MRARINSEMKEAMRAGDKRKLATLRLINCAVNDRDIERRGTGGDRCCDDDIRAILAKMIKQREDSARAYEEASRLELAQRERDEIAIIREFLPQPLSAEEAERACREVVAEVDAHSLRDMGRCMNALKERYVGRMDMGAASRQVKEILAQPSG